MKSIESVVLNNKNSYGNMKINGELNNANWQQCVLYPFRMCMYVVFIQLDVPEDHSFVVFLKIRYMQCVAFYLVHLFSYSHSWDFVIFQLSDGFSGVCVSFFIRWCIFIFCICNQIPFHKQGLKTIFSNYG